MSEPNSLLLRVKINKEKLEQFLTAPFDMPVLDENWISWWDNRKMFAKTKMTQSDFRNYNLETNTEIVNLWKEVKNSVTFSDYGAEEEIWRFGIMLFSENYFEMLPMIVFMKSIANYIDQDAKNFGLIYNYLWDSDENDVSAFINFSAGSAELDSHITNKKQLSSIVLNEANHYFDKKRQENHH